MISTATTATKIPGVGQWAGPANIALLAAMGAGNGRKMANAFTSNFENKFHNDVLKRAATLNPLEAQGLVRAEWPKFLSSLDQYVNSFNPMIRPQAQTIVNQMFSNQPFMGTVRSLMGDDPLGETYTAPFFEKVAGAGKSILGGLGSVLSKIITPTVKGTPPFVPSSSPGSGGTMPNTGSPSINSGITQSPWLPLLLGGVSAVGGAINNTQGARTSTSTPTIAPQFQTLADLLRTRAQQRLMDSVDMSGLAANGIGNINQAFRGIEQSNNANLTARGLASSPVAATVGANTNMERGGQIAQFLNNLPILQRQLSNQDISAGSEALRFGTGNASVGAGSALGSGISSAAEMLAFLAGQGLLGKG